MKQHLRGWALPRWLTLGGTIVGLAVAQTSPARPTVTVCLSHTGPASAQDVAEMKESAVSVFRHAGVGLVWLDCWRGRLLPDKAGQPYKTGLNFIRLRIVDHVDNGGIHTLGWTEPGSFAATLVYRPVQDIARNSGVRVSIGIVLGHAAAHEIGHILFGSSNHDASGLMKARYAYTELLRMAWGTLLFTDEESQTLRSRLVTRSLEANVQTATLTETRAVLH